MLGGIRIRCGNDEDYQNEAAIHCRSPIRWEQYSGGLRCTEFSFPGSAWERAVPRLCLVASRAIRNYARKLSLRNFAEAEPPVLAFPGRAWERANSHPFLNSVRLSP